MQQNKSSSLFFETDFLYNKNSIFYYLLSRKKSNFLDVLLYYLYE